jgi:hypothetical protein
MDITLSFDSPPYRRQKGKRKIFKKVLKNSNSNIFFKKIYRFHFPLTPHQDGAIGYKKCLFMNINAKNVTEHLRDWCFTTGTKFFARTASVKMSRNLCRPFRMKSPMPFAENYPRVKDENIVWNAGTPELADRLPFSREAGPPPIQLRIKVDRSCFNQPFPKYSQMFKPPSAKKMLPVEKLLCSEARNSTILATSPARA